MTIGSWILFAFFAICIIALGLFMVFEIENIAGKIISAVAAVLLIIGLFVGFRWYYQNTASGQRALIDQQSDLGNGLERTVTVYTANGEIIAQYTGKIDIEGNDGGYVLFDYEGKRYTYYNCFVESIAEIRP
jgi:amino acid permease